MFLRQLDLTTALRPSLLPDEALLFVQDSVGLYEGKFKTPNYQNGHAYLTSHRACYVDNEEPRKYSFAVDLKDVDHPEYYAGFLKSSPKITLLPKPSKRASLSLRTPQSPRGHSYSSSASTPPARYGSPVPSWSPAPPSPTSAVSATWVCPVCGFSNPVPSNFDPATANDYTTLPPCLACGVKPPLALVLKATLASAANRQAANIPDRRAMNGAKAGSIQCPRCTFENHPSISNCEMCGASLLSVIDKRLQLDDGPASRPESPGPTLSGLSLDEEGDGSVKFSFRSGGAKVFFERLENALVQRKWLLQSAPPIPKPSPIPGSSGQRNGSPSSNGPYTPPQRKNVGIADLALRDQEQRKTAEMMIGSAFEDLEALMTSAKEIIQLAESFASQSGVQNGDADASALLSQSASAMGLVTTKDMLGSGSTSELLYVSELSRNLAEFLTDDAKGVLKKAGGIMSLVDLWAVFNRARGGVELISPTDFHRAAELWEKLKLPVRLRRFRSGLLVVQDVSRTDDRTIASILSWLQELHVKPPADAVAWDWQQWGRGITAQDAGQRFGWSIGVATEELEMAEEQGALCREQGIDGVRFWENWLTQGDLSIRT